MKGYDLIEPAKLEPYYEKCNEAIKAEDLDTRRNLYREARHYLHQQILELRDKLPYYEDVPRDKPGKFLVRGFPPDELWVLTVEANRQVSRDYAIGPYLQRADNTNDDLLPPPTPTETAIRAERRARWIATTTQCPSCRYRIPANQAAVTEHESRHCRFPKCSANRNGPWKTFDTRMQHELYHALDTVGVGELVPGDRFDRLFKLLKVLGGDVFAPAVQGVIVKQLRAFGVDVRRARLETECARCGLPIARRGWILETAAGWRHLLCPSPQGPGSSTT